MRASSRPATCLVGVVALLSALLAGCTGEPQPQPTPTPTSDETTEPAPSGVRVAVVLPPPTDPSSAAFLEVERELAALEDERTGDVASIRAVLPDDPAFVGDVAALMAEEGNDLVCVLGADGAREVVRLADRFPATRFCALGPPRENGPDNVDLIEVGHEEVGHVLGVAAATAATGDPVGLVVGDDGEEQARRRAGARAALSTADVVLDAIVTDTSEASDIADAVEDAGVVALIIDIADAGAATVVAAASPNWVGPRGVAVDASAGQALVRWALRADVVVGAAIDRLVTADVPDDPDPLGFAQDAVTLTYGEAVPDAVRAATEVAAEELASGTREPLETTRRDVLIGPDPDEDDGDPPEPRPDDDEEPPPSG